MRSLEAFALQVAAESFLRHEARPLPGPWVLAVGILKMKGGVFEIPLVGELLWALLFWLASWRGPTKTYEKACHGLNNKNQRLAAVRTTFYRDLKS